MIHLLKSKNDSHCVRAYGIEFWNFRSPKKNEINKHRKLMIEEISEWMKEGRKVAVNSPLLARFKIIIITCIRSIKDISKVTSINTQEGN